MSIASKTVKGGLICVAGPVIDDVVRCADCDRPMEWLRTANNFNYKKLRKEPFFAKPEVRGAIEMIHRRYPRQPVVQGWLLREARRGRLITTPQWTMDVQRLMEAERSGDEQAIQQANDRLDGDRPDVVLFDHSHTDENGQPRAVQPGMVMGLSRMLDAASAQGKGIDLLQHEFPKMYPMYEDWQKNNRRHAPGDGEVVHAFPNGYTMRRIVNPDEAYTEAELMQNCVSKFAPHLNNGQFHIFSLRDEQNQPHANVLIAPQNLHGHWEGGIVRDIRGKQNAKPSPTYAPMLRQWFDNFNVAPTVRYDRHPPMPQFFPPNAEEYGLQTHPSFDEEGFYPANGFFDPNAAGYGRQAKLSWVFEAARIDTLANEPAVQADPKLQEFLAWLRNCHYEPNGDQRHWRGDIMAPWLLRQVQRGNMDYSTANGLTFAKQELPWPEELQGEFSRLKDRYIHAGYMPDEADRLTRRRLMYREEWEPYLGDAQPVPMDQIANMGDWLNTKHPTRKGLDLNNKKLDWDTLNQKYGEYQEYLKAKRSQESRVPGFEGPNGEFMKALLPDETHYEGTQMQNCIKMPGMEYGKKIGNMESLLYSLRQKDGNGEYKPRADIEIKPKWARNKKTGEMAQIGEMAESPYGGMSYTPTQKAHEIRQLGQFPDDHDWQPLPQEGWVIQVQGKHNAPPPADLHPLINQFFTSPHFMRPDGTDARPHWYLPTGTHFTHMGQLWSGADNEDEGGQHVCYYHPGDFGLPDPGVTTDYDNMVRTIPTHSNATTRDKALKHLANWAMHHGDLDRLHEALNSEPTQNFWRAQAAGYSDPHDDPHFQQWNAENPRPEPPMEPERPNFGGEGAMANCTICGGQHAVDPTYNEYYCPSYGYRNYDALNAPVPPEHQQQAWDYADQHERYQQQAEAFQQQYEEWKEERARQQQAASARAGEAAWPNSKQKQSIDMLQNFINQRMDNYRVASATHDYGCLHENCTGWHFAFVVESNWNRLRNQLTAQGQFENPRDQMAYYALKHHFEPHENLAEFLMREFKQRRLSPQNLPVPANLTNLRDNLEYYERELAQQQERMDWRVQEQGWANHDEALAQDHRYRDLNQDLRYWQRNVDATQRQLAEAEAGMRDPEHMDYSKVQWNTNTQSSDTGAYTRAVPLDADLVRHIAEEQRKRSQRLKSLKDRDLKARLNSNDVEERQKAWEEAKELGFKQPNLLETNLEDIVPDAFNSLKAERGRALGRVIHTYPNGWTLRHINTAAAAQNESDQLGHCIRGYGDLIENGSSLNLSLRDKKGNAHVTMELKPQKRGLNYDWDKIESQVHNLNAPAICPECGGELNEEGRCTKCKHVVDANENYVDYTPEQIAQFKAYNAAKASGNAVFPDMDYDERDRLSDEYEKFQRHAIISGHATPDWRAAKATQIEGKSNEAPHPRYHGYIRDWMTSMPQEDRPVSAWSSYFNSMPIHHVNDLQDYVDKVDEFGAHAPNRTIDWPSVVHSFTDGQPELKGSAHLKSFQPMPSNPEARFDPALAQKAYEFAAANNQLMPLYAAVNNIEAYKPKAAVKRNPSNIECPSCHRTENVYANHYGEGHHYCGYCGEEFDAPVPPAQQWTPKPTGPAYTPYQAQAVQYMTPLLQQHPDIETLGLHGAPGIGTMSCTHCGGRVGPCQTCPAADHGQCEDCHRIVFYDGRQARTANLIGHKIPEAHVGANGKTCYCLWNDSNRHLQDEMDRHQRTAALKTADKLNDFLRNPQARPDLQTPEAQGWLNHLEETYATPQTDELLPWLTREWKKKRVFGPDMPVTNPQTGEVFTPNYAGYFHPETARATPIMPGELQHWGDWYHSNHPTRRGRDIMQMQIHHMPDIINQWDEDMAGKAGGGAETAGRVEHRWPDGWTFQRLEEEKALKDEGDKMGHCVGGYGPAVRDGRSLIYSLRDDKNEPHATMEIGPNEAKCLSCGEHQSRKYGQGNTHDCALDGCNGKTELVPHNGVVEQIQGKGNGALKPEYQQRIKDWVESTMPDHDDRPTWANVDVNDYDDLMGEEGGGYTTYHGGDYGLDEPDMNVDWGDVIDSVCDYYGGDSVDHRKISNIVEKAAEQGQLSDLEYGLEDWEDKAKRSARSDFESEYQYDPESYIGHDFEDSRFYEDPPDQDDYEVENPHYEDEEETPHEPEHIFDQDSYDEAYREWESRMEQAKQDWMSDAEYEAFDRWWDNEEDERARFYSEMQGEIHAAMRRTRHASWRELKPVVARHTPHNNWSTGEPCNCSFTTHFAPPPPAIVDGAPASGVTSSTHTCDTCGDELDEMGSCQRCDWGGWNPVDDATAPYPTDVTRDVRPGIQAAMKTACPSCSSHHTMRLGFGEAFCSACEDTFYTEGDPVPDDEPGTLTLPAAWSKTIPEGRWNWSGD